MAERPVFVPAESGYRLVHELQVPFVWQPGMAPSQKKKNVVALHESAAKRGLSPLLEISSKSEREIGRRLSAFYLKVDINGYQTTVWPTYRLSLGRKGLSTITGYSFLRLAIFASTISSPKMAQTYAGLRGLY
jgi:hypothetical protein